MDEEQKPRSAGRPKTGRNFFKINVSVPNGLEPAVIWARDNGGLSATICDCLKAKYEAAMKEKGVTLPPPPETNT